MKFNINGFKSMTQNLFQKIFGSSNYNTSTISSPLLVQDNSYISDDKHKEDHVTTHVINNPLQPFLKRYDGGSSLSSHMQGYPESERNEFSIKNLENLYAKEKRPMTEKQYIDVFNQYISIKNFLNEEKSPILKKMWEDIEKLNIALEPLRQLGVKYSLDLTGGCVRDFVLNQHHHIKDLDVMISLSGINDNDTIYNSENLVSKNIFSQTQLDNVNWNNDNSSDTKKHHLLLLCLNKFEFSNDLGEVYFFNSEDRTQFVGQEDYNGALIDVEKQDRLISVIKTKGTTTHYPIDLLLTDLIKPEFLQLFDFDICKASFCMVNTTYKKDFPKDYSHLLSRFSAELDFWADVVNQKISYSTYQRSVKQIEKSCYDHFPRIAKKYLSYELNIYNKNGHFYHYAVDTFTKHLNFIKLETELNKRDDTPIIKRQKI